MPSKARNKQESKSKKVVDPPNPPPRVNWPLLQPLPPAQDLSLETVLPGQIVVIRNFFTSTLCKNYVSFLSSLPLVTTPAKPKDGDAVRVNDRIKVDDHDFAQQLWSATCLSSLLQGSSGALNEDGLTPEAARALWGGETCGLNPRIRIYRYREGQFFAQHYDESNNIILPTTPSTPAKTTWTLLIYLTGPSTGCIGGETVFYPELGPAKKFSGISSQGTEPISVGLEVGMALLHKHGQDCLLHEGQTVTKGEKWVIRSDLCVQR